ncbi:Choline dehydrogenase [Nitrosospira multiformis]|uniref:Choline dehydrogenase n=2 Tax=Nitrosospira multiformis TaxID=1231 RepID=A0A1H8DHT1_9PROT|nr:Choline dehydrogenase [Nitrosospira multiformis]
MHDFMTRDWDVVVVGTGMGGATLGYALAKAGKQVLFCEKGHSHLGASNSVRGNYAETFFDQISVPQLQHRNILSNAGRYQDQLEDQSKLQPYRFIPFIGSGTGGSTALYGMALERFFPSDFLPFYSHPTAPGTTLPREWPISYETLVPYYKAAEQLYRVHGSGDPMRGESKPEHFFRPPPLTPASQELWEFLEGKGLHPYRLPMACEYVPDCECCQGYLCAKNCKNDSARICLLPAISQYHAKLLDQCVVLKLEASRHEVNSLICSWRGEIVKLRARTIVLAAGALETPALLLRSSSSMWPQGLANDSGLVGKNLMRHNIDLYVVSPREVGLIDNRQKELAFNDLYYRDGKKLGSVQTFGRLPPGSLLAESMEEDIRNGKQRLAIPLFKLVKPMIKPFLNRLVSRNLVLATIMEDLPYEDNFVKPSLTLPNSLIINYRMRPYELERIATFRALMKDILKPYKVLRINQAENNERIAHVCGTCRFGTDPRESVLDSNNRAHGIANLYVIDSSFFPSSGGTNPGLTIAANALRVAEHLIGKNPSVKRK